MAQLFIVKLSFKTSSSWQDLMQNPPVVPYAHYLHYSISPSHIELL